MPDYVWSQLVAAATTLYFAAIFFGLLVLISRIFEKRWPAQQLPWREVILDYKVAGANFFMNWLLTPLVTASSVVVVNAFGGGFIELPASGFGMVISVIVLLLVGDLIGYFIHRAQHRFPVLWAMHSLHHSASALTVITGTRHFWFETAFLSALFPFLPILFKTTPQMMLIVTLISFLPNGCAHLNVRLHLGKFGLWINNPQFHRIHHSVLPEHLNKNFSAIFPLWDVVFGTAWTPTKTEFPNTGLVPAQKPSGFIDSVVWPLRRLRRFALARQV